MYVFGLWEYLKKTSVHMGRTYKVNTKMAANSMWLYVIVTTYDVPFADLISVCQCVTYRLENLSGNLPNKTL